MTEEARERIVDVGQGFQAFGAGLVDITEETLEDSPDLDKEEQWEGLDTVMNDHAVETLQELVDDFNEAREATTEAYETVAEEMNEAADEVEGVWESPLASKGDESGSESIFAVA